MSENLKLSNQICFPFYAISRSITKGYTPYLKEIDLTYPQYLVMLILWEKDNLLVKDICKKLYLETNTVSPLLKNLEKKWFIFRKKSKNNDKEIYILLTDNWANMKLKAEGIPAKLLSWFDIDWESLKQLKGNLNILMETLEKKDKR